MNAISDEEHLSQRADKLCRTLAKYETTRATNKKHKLQASPPEGPPVKKQKQSDQPADTRWSCPECTFLNKLSQNECDICSTPKLRKRNNGSNTESPQSATNEWGCPTCTFRNKSSQTRCEICNTSRSGDTAKQNEDTKPLKKPIAIRIETHIISNEKKDTFKVEHPYSDTETLHHVLGPIINVLQRKYYASNYKLKVYKITDTNDQVQVHDVSLAHPITVFAEKQLMQKGLKITLRACYHHRVRNREITCAYMRQSRDPLQCPVYYAMREKHECKEEYLAHLQEFSHFESESVDKAACKHKDECKAYVRMEQGGNALADRCHMASYRHPPRNSNIKLAANVRAFIMNTKERQNRPLYEPTEQDRYRYSCNKRDRFLSALIQEVVRNGFKNDLCVKCGRKDVCRHNDYSLLQTVEEKLKHPRHRAVNSPLSRDQMLALLLYTGCECNMDLCASQRGGDYTKWKWFDYCLYFAIFQLSFREEGSFSVFSGLAGVKLDKKEVACGFLNTYMSTSWNRKVAETFMGGKGNKGMILEIDEKYKSNGLAFCCDVSWISRFPDECEVLFARSLDANTWSKFKCVVVNDAANGVQDVKLTM